MKYISKDILFTFSKMGIVIIWMGTWVNDAIHIQVKIVKVRNLEIQQTTVQCDIINQSLNQSINKQKHNTKDQRSSLYMWPCNISDDRENLKLKALIILIISEVKSTSVQLIFRHCDYISLLFKNTWCS